MPKRVFQSKRVEKVKYLSDFQEMGGKVSKSEMIICIKKEVEKSNATLPYTDTRKQKYQNVRWKADGICTRSTQKCHDSLIHIQIICPYHAKRLLIGIEKQMDCRRYIQSIF